MPVAGPGGSESADDFHVVQIEKQEGSTPMARLGGLDEVLRLAPEGRPVVMLGEREYLDDLRWHAALGYPNVVFRKSPLTREGIVEALSEASKRARPADPLAIYLRDAQLREERIRDLTYELYSARKAGEEALLRWEEKAKVVFGDLSRADLTSKVTAAGTGGRRGRLVDLAFPNLEFPDTCIDLMRTLVNGSTVRVEVVAIAREQSMKRPITIWTAGDLEAAEGILRHHGIPWKIIRRPSTTEIRVAQIIDDLPEEEFRIQHPLIVFGDYIQV